MFELIHLPPIAIGIVLGLRLDTRRLGYMTMGLVFLALIAATFYSGNVLEQQLGACFLVFWTMWITWLGRRTISDYMRSVDS